MRADGTPRWEPLLALFSARQAAEWMWMGWVAHPAGGRIELYKHAVTRRHLSLDERGGAWLWDTDEDLYRPCERHSAIHWALGESDERPAGT